MQDFAWGDLNAGTKIMAPMEAMIFGGTLQKILQRVLDVEPHLVPLCNIKLYLTNTYMRIFVQL